jgi:uncharacterized OB-fold protein
VTSTRPDAGLVWTHRCKGCGTFVRLSSMFCLTCEKEHAVNDAWRRALDEGRVRATATGGVVTPPEDE